MIKKAPVILGFDTSSAACRVALMRGEDVLDHVVEEMSKGQAERLMGLCEEVLTRNGFAATDLAAIGVGTGPGNFTGTRISVSAARGMALGLSIRAVGVSAFDALRFGHSGPCACSVDARRGAFYLQRFDQKEAGLDPVLIEASENPEFEGPMIGHKGQEALYPTAIAICRATAEQYTRPVPRPAPLYIRPADAAPARDAPPTILA